MTQQMTGAVSTKTEDTIKKVAITFDDGPSPECVDTLLMGLKNRGVKATFFLIGKKAKEHPELVRRMQEDGHLLGNHSYTHENLAEISKEEAFAEIVKTNEIIKEITGQTPEYLRPPFGCCEKELEQELHMIEVLWDVDPKDWAVMDTATVVERVTNKCKDGDVILLHDCYATSVAAAMEIIDILQAQGYQFVTVDELIFE